MIEKVLIANRGEIARRLLRACRDVGVAGVAVYAEQDEGASWLAEADEAYLLPGSSASETFLNQDALVDVARRSGADAVHPGYGFLAENPAFAATCARAGIVFVGPSPEAMAVLGDKVQAKQAAAAAGVPTVPGFEVVGRDDKGAAAAARDLGFPLLIKASAGGGGRGMRIVNDDSAFLEEVRAARAEAASAFGDDRLLVEKFFPTARHVEVQILGDTHGNLIHLGERECSIQRRHQKILEESPSPGIDPDLRRRIAEAATALGRHAGYHSAGTVEFIVEPDGGFHLLEVNTRLQVEHPVTEAVTGVDLAVWQLRIASGEELAIEAQPAHGHAIEARIYAEDPATQFMPSAGTLEFYRPPSGPGIRVDDAVIEGESVSATYDPLIAKVIAHGSSREVARRRLIRALSDTVIIGVTTNLPYLLDILLHPAFVAGETPTRFLADHFQGWTAPGLESPEEWAAAAAFEVLRLGGQERAAAAAAEQRWPGAGDPWGVTDAWGSAGSQGRYGTEVDGRGST